MGTGDTTGEEEIGLASGGLLLSGEIPLSGTGVAGSGVGVGVLSCTR